MDEETELYQTIAKKKRNNLIARLGFYHMVQEYIFTNFKRDADSMIKTSSIKGFAQKLGKSLALRLIEEKMILMRNSEEKIKFLCQEVWHFLFGKTVDKLFKVKNQFHITEQRFQFLEGISSNDKRQQAELEKYFLVFFQALFESVLGVLDMQTTVEIMGEGQSAYTFKVFSNK